MDNNVSFLITLYDEQWEMLHKCAFKVNRDKFIGDVFDYPMEKENLKELHSMLPQHVQTIGPIVNVETIFEVSIYQ